MDKLVKYEFIWAWPAYSAQKSFHDKLYIGKLLILYMVLLGYRTVDFLVWRRLC